MEDEGLALSIITLVELYKGVFRSNDPDRGENILRDFLRGVTVLGLNQDISRIFCIEHTRLRSVGTPIGDLDLLIAATALHYDLTLLTSDSDFQRVEGLQLIST